MGSGTGSLFLLLGCVSTSLLIHYRMFKLFIIHITHCLYIPPIGLQSNHINAMINAGEHQASPSTGFT